MYFSYFYILDVVIYIGFDMPKADPFIKDADRNWVKYVSVALMALHQAVWLVLQFRKLCMKDENGEDIDEKKQVLF